MRLWPSSHGLNGQCPVLTISKKRVICENCNNTERKQSTHSSGGKPVPCLPWNPVIFVCPCSLPPQIHACYRKATFLLLECPILHPTTTRHSMEGSETWAQHCSSGNCRTPVTGMCFEDDRRTGPRSSYPGLPASYPLLLVFKVQRMGRTHTYIWFTLLHASVHVEKNLSWKKHPRDLGPGIDLIKPWVVFHPLWASVSMS